MVCGEADDAVCGLDAAGDERLKATTMISFGLANLSAGARKKRISKSTKRWSKAEFVHILAVEQFRNVLDSRMDTRGSPSAAWGLSQSFPEAASAKGKI